MTEHLVETTERLDRFVVERIPGLSRTKAVSIIDEGLVLVNGEVRRHGFPLKPGMVVTIAGIEPVSQHDLTPADLPLEIICDDPDFLIINKPRGLATHPAPGLKEPTLVNALLAQNVQLSTVGGAFRPGIVHRLDKPTTGLIIVAKNDHAHRILAAQISARTASRQYVAYVTGVPDQRVFRIEAPIARDPKNRLKMSVNLGGKDAATTIHLIAPFESGALVRCVLDTGRTHQIRVHLSACGHPVMGDELYGAKNDAKFSLQLHAAFLRFVHPRSEELLEFFVAPPDDFRAHALVNKALFIEKA